MNLGAPARTFRSAKNSAAVANAKSFWREFQDDDITGLAAECAFRFFLAFFPFVLFLVTLAAFTAQAAGTDDPSARVLDLFGDSLPRDAASVMERQVNEVVGGASIGLLSISFLGALWAAAGGAGALIKAVNRVYDLPETRKFWEKSAMSVGLTLLGAFTLISAVAAVMLTQGFADSIASSLGLGSELGWLVQVVRLPFIALFVMLAAQSMYWLAPDKRQGASFSSWGATGFAVGWAAFTLGFALYVSHFGSYDATYGALAGVVILLFWFYVSSILFLAGAELNWWIANRAALAITPEKIAATDATRVPRPESRTRGLGDGAVRISGDTADKR